LDLSICGAIVDNIRKQITKKLKNNNK